MAGMISIIGPSRHDCTAEIYDLGLDLGQSLVDSGYAIVCGGRWGIMEAVCKGAHQSEHYQWGQTVGILPDADREKANAYVDIAIPTGMQFARNQAVVLSGRAVVAIAGGAGTLSEIALAWQYGKRIITVDRFDGWGRQLAGQVLDSKFTEPTMRAGDVPEVIQGLAQILR